MVEEDTSAKTVKFDDPFRHKGNSQSFISIYI